MPEFIPSGDLVAITGSGQARLLGRDATDILDRPNASPLAILLASPTNRLALFDPANGRVLTDRNVDPKSFLAPDETRLAARIPLASTVSEIINAIQISDVTTGLTSTIDIYDNYSLRYANVLLGWGPKYIYGARHDRWIHYFWWIDPNAPRPERQEFFYGGEGLVDQIVLNARTDTIAYSWIPSNVTLDVITTTLVLRNMVTDAEQIVDTGLFFDHLALSPNGQYLVAMHQEAPADSTSELRLYDLAQPGSSQTLGNSLIPDTVVQPWEAYYYLSSYIYAWSPDSAYVLVLTASSADEQSHRREALIFRTEDGTLIDTVTLPSETGSLHLTNDARLFMITYQGDEASLSVYDTTARSFYQPLPLGVQTPIIVYVPEL